MVPISVCSNLLLLFGLFLSSQYQKRRMLLGRK